MDKVYPRRSRHVQRSQSTEPGSDVGAIVSSPHALRSPTLIRMERSCEEEQGGLEIISIGTLYSGPWDKKYWSSSRGKDRYPYPVGYQALRAHDGITDRLEIQEGFKGPLFLINCSNGQSFSGPTPEIAWDRYKRKCSSHKVVFPRKRSSRKVDGVQFFGFRSPFVQRILRELVANVNGVAEQNALSNIYDGLAERNNDVSSFQSQHKFGIRRKKSKCCDVKDTKPKGSIRLEELKGDLFDSIRDVSCWGEDKIVPNSVQSVSCASDSVHGTCNPQVDSAVAMGSSSAAREDNSTAFGQDSLVGYVHSFGAKHKPEESRSEDFAVEKSESILHAENGNQEAALVSNGLASLFVADSCVSDTLEVMKDMSSDPDSTRLRKTPHDVMDNLPTLDNMGVRLQPSQEIIPSHSSPKKNDIDIARQELAKSMMLFLLPQALPLLKNSLNHVHNADPSSLLFNGVNSADDNNGDFTEFKITDQMLIGSDFSEVKENSDKLTTEPFPPPDPMDVKCVVSDSFENEDCEVNKDNVTSLTPRDPENKELTSAVDTQKKFIDSDTAFSNPNLVFHSGTQVPCCEEAPRSRGEMHSFAVDAPFPERKMMNGISLGADVRSKSECLESCSKESLYDHNGGTHRHIDKVPENPDPSELAMFTSQKSAAAVQIKDMLNGMEMEPCTQLVYHEHMKRDHDLENIVQLLGCYVHPMPVSSVLLCSKENEVHVCVLCGHLTSRDRVLFLYKLSIQGPITGNPSFFGYVQISLPPLEDDFGPRIAADGLYLQFTPNGQGFAMINSISAPLCREQAVGCKQSTCSMDCRQGNTIVVAQVKSGYFLVLGELATLNRIFCILVSGHKHLAAVEEDRGLHIWVMNAAWSAHVEEFILSTKGILSGCILELKKIPRCDSVILGHNGSGEFGLWDINRRTLVSKFTADGVSVGDFIPISLYNWESKTSIPKSTDTEGDISRTLETTNNRAYGHGFLNGEDASVWLVVSTTNYFNPPQSHQPKHIHTSSLKEWRLALLARKTMILGSPLDEKATIVGALSKYGLIATCHGLVYLWEFSTGRRLGTLYSFKGDDVSCVAVDNSCLSVMAVASGGQLLVYLQPDPGACMEHAVSSPRKKSEAATEVVKQQNYPTMFAGTSA